MKQKRTKENKYRTAVRRKLAIEDPSMAFRVLVQPYSSGNASLRSIATRLGVVDIVEEPLPVDGAIVLDGQHRLTIKLNSSRSQERRRFTLGHEIGHLILHKTLGFVTSCQRDPELESACDAIAAELLMPTDETIEFVKQQGSLSPEKLQRIADSFGVSLQAAARRITRDLKLWAGAIGLWEIDTNVRQMWIVGRRFWKHATPQFAAFRYALTTPDVVKTRESFVEGDLVTPVRIEMLHLGQGRILGFVAQ